MPRKTQSRTPEQRVRVEGVWGFRVQGVGVGVQFGGFRNYGTLI